MTTYLPGVRCGDVVRMRGERWRIVRCVAHGGAATVEAAGCGPGNRAAGARFLLPFEPVDRLPASGTPRAVTPAKWRHIARHALAAAAPSWTSLRAAAHATLDVIPFQLEPALALVRGAGCRYLLADAVGLGKTVQAGLMIAETLARRPDARALVIAPAGLRDQWRAELRLRFGLEAAVLDAAGVARLAAQLPLDVNPWAVQQIAITSMDYVKRPETLRALEALTWDVMVFDEAHNLAGRSDRAAAASLLADRARALALLTATPHSGDDAAFARLCALGNPRGDDPLVVFRRSRADAALAGSRRSPLLRVRPTAPEAAMHTALMQYARRVWTEGSDGARLVASVLARRACSSATSLARSVERRLALLGRDGMPGHVQPTLLYGDADADDGEPEGVLGLQGLCDPADERAHLEEVLRLAHLAGEAESKVATLKRLLSRIDEPAIVFTEYRDTLRRLAAALAVDGIVELHGGQTTRERAEALHRFTAGRAVLMLATDAGSEGLNLHRRCRLVINLELPWTPLRLEQRAGRVDRIGQARRVHVVHLVAAGTCEETTLARLVRRQDRSRGTLTAFETPLDERGVAESVLADRPLGWPREDRRLPPGTIALDLGDEAAAEAAWIRQARALGREPVVTDTRPVVTRVRRRSRRATPARGVWVFRLAFVDREGQLVWESLAALEGEVITPRGPTHPRLRDVLDPRHPALQRLVDVTAAARLGALQSSVDPGLRLFREREHAMIDALRARHARLSAPLVQRGLFDNRNDRLASAQAALLDRALTQSRDRLADLDACSRLRLADGTLLFAVVLE
jgi:superfamily II DNA or RNA helicase